MAGPQIGPRRPYRPTIGIKNLLAAHPCSVGDELGSVPQDRFWAAGVPFAFHGNALLVGFDPLTGDTASRPQMTIDEFQRLITFDIPSHGWRLPMLVPKALEQANLGGGC